ncbi:MAG: glycosyltransferase family 4 protein [Acidobacteriia bacterium]|nr:glycosyltransferase family 4 protein [Terriglobia bacterium]
MTTVAYIANEFPSPVEPYVKDEIGELRRRGVRVICCSGKRVAPQGLSRTDRSFWDETRYFQPLSDDELMRAARHLVSDRSALWQFLKPMFWECGVSPTKRLRVLAHTVMGAVLAEELAPLGVEHIHAHHGYFASWMALVAARLLGIGFSLTLHGSDLLRRADLLGAKLRACQFCVTISDFNRSYILKRYPSTPESKVIVQRLGVDRVHPSPVPINERQHRFCLLAVGRLHRVKNYSFLIQACAALRDEGLDVICWIVGEGPERRALERQIKALRLQERVYLIGYVPPIHLSGYYRYANLVALTSLSEGIPIVLMEAMAHEKHVLAPAITGIPELVEHGRTGFLYEPGSLPDFLSSVRWILSNQASIANIPRAAAANVACFYNRQRNLRCFADQFLTRIAKVGTDHAYPLLQQIRLSV